MMKRNTDIHIEKIFIIFAIVLIGLALFLAKAAGDNLEKKPEDEKRLELEDIFKKADLIPDGKIDPGEFDIYHYSLFTKFDFNENGWVEKDECMTDCFSYRAWVGREAEKAKIYRKYEFGETPYRFDAIDINQSGDIEVFEYILFGRERFPYFDKDKSGTIEIDEFCDAYSASMPCDFSPEYLEELMKKEPHNEKNPVSN